MPAGFYDLLGLDQDATPAQLRTAYAGAVARHAKRRRATADAGGDTTALDHARSQLDEAWSVLSEPSRRRRYDALLSWTSGDRDARRLWEQVGPLLVPPALGHAVRLVRQLTRLHEVGDLTVAPGPKGDEPPTLVPHDEDLTSPRVPMARLAPTPVPAEVVEMPSLSSGTPISAARRATPVPGLRLVDGAQDGSAVLVLRPDGSRRRALLPEEISRLVDAHGWSGALLRAVREAREMTLDDLADTTRISLRYLEALESDEFGALPSATFVRGYLREVARVLGLDEAALVAGMLQRMEP